MSLYSALANLIEYPRADFLIYVDQCLVLSSGEIQTLLQAFRRQVGQVGVPRLQELYIDTFDLQAETSPYVGHHLFGEDTRRNLFMAMLRERYRQSGLTDTVELPDHLANVLRFLALTGADEERAELVHHCLIPALQHLLRALKPDNPYASLSQALLLAWRQEDNYRLHDREIAWIPFSSLSSPTSR